ncbi:Polysulfide reductase NrfD [Geoglobus ahangari]|uniref:Polysulfide reductase NrfD n=1 Tax=Geoglobus ahangari TaxID=113653 RepID=A0A0F7DBN7_9EURY|nr:NrfD/PsrC family molybdoenzyme membrane anchor subunit [Geoglobus ahangari]AKG91411.1 Polysulfide reductase NrfD [Geoglobus ahangari]
MRRKYDLAMGVLGVLAIIGIVAFIYQLQKGLILTNMRNPFSWGLYIAMWAFYVGTAAGGLVVSSAINIFGVKQLKPIAPVASLSAFIFAVAAMIMVLPDIGRPDRIFNMFLYPNPKSLLPWDFLVLSTYAFLSAVYTYVQLEPRIAERGISLPLVGTILKKPNLTSEQLEMLRRKSERRAKMLAPIALPFAILIHTVTAWVLATQLSRPWWYGGLLAPTFIAAALTAGPAVVIIASLIVYGFKDELKPTYRLLAKISAFSAVALLFMYYNDFFIRQWWDNGKEYDALMLVFRDYLHIHAIEAIFLLAGIIILAKKYDSVQGLVAGSLAVNIGILAHRYLLIPPAYNLIPFRVPVVMAGESFEWQYPIAVGEVRGTLFNPQPIFVSYWNYVPSPVEIAITVGVFALISFVFLGLLRALPVRE